MWIFQNDDWWLWASLLIIAVGCVAVGYVFGKTSDRDGGDKSMRD